ncbi:hypothetical protein [Streptomyces syringium]|uniref:hypothetical protein n=1 Tax=Streptomyces syringium TaxID=76729 RepID=UPI003453CDCD
MRKAARRVAVAAGMVVAAGALQFAATAPASASPAQCRTYLSSYKYQIGVKVEKACSFAHDGWKAPGDPISNRQKCMIELDRIGVKAQHANRACNAD